MKTFHASTEFRDSQRSLSDLLFSVAFGMTHSGFILTLVFLAFASSSSAVKDPTMKGANAANHTVDAKGGQKLERLQGLKASPNRGGALGGLPSGNVGAPGKVDPQLQQTEKNDSKIAAESSAKKPQRTRVSNPSQTGAQGSMTINFRSAPRRATGSPNKQGNGSGSSRKGTGRRISEKTH